jgi:hypothetical protein
MSAVFAYYLVYRLPPPPPTTIIAAAVVLDTLYLQCGHKTNATEEGTDMLPTYKISTEPHFHKSTNL